jgi:hypothetical protein
LNGDVDALELNRIVVKKVVASKLKAPKRRISRGPQRGGASSTWRLSFDIFARRIVGWRASPSMWRC